MLRIRVDLTACNAGSKDMFWRLERSGIFQKTVFEYASNLLKEYGISGVHPVTYLDGTLIPGTESPLIFRDGDLVRIVPGRSCEVQVISSVRNTNEHTRDMETPVNGNSNGPSNGIDKGGRLQRDAVSKLTPASPENTEEFEESDISENNGLKKKRKRGKRQSRVRSKRVSFDLLGEDNDRQSVPIRMESTPFKSRVPCDNLAEEPDATLVETRSEAYVTALEDMTPGVSQRSKTSMKATSARKARKAQSGVGYYLGLLGSGDNSLMSGTNSSNGFGSPANRQLQAGPSNLTFDGSQNDDESQGNLSAKKETMEKSLVSTLQPSARISCDIGMFNLETSDVENYPSLILEVIDNNKEKKALTVKHVHGTLPSFVNSGEFKVDWGMLSSLKIL